MGMAHSAQGVYHEEIQLVENEIDLYFYDSQIEAGPLDGGIAVMVDTNGAYWVHEGTVYAANGQAKAWSPGLSSSPDGITWNSVFWAVKKEK